MIKDKELSTQPWKNMSIMLLSQKENRYIVGSEFMITDNLDDSDNSDDVEIQHYMNYPFKLENVFMVVCTKGHMRLWVNLKEYDLTPGSVMVGLPGDIGQCVERSRDNRSALMAFDPNFIDNIDTHFYGKFQALLNKQPMLNPGKEFFNEILEILAMIKKKIRQPGFQFQREAVNGYLQVLCANGYQWLSEHNAMEDKGPELNRADSIFYRFLDVVRENYTRERTIGFYADKLCLTPKYLSSVIFKSSGRYAGDWIKDYVILEAKALLRSRKYTVSQVCDKLNFSSASFFVRYFKSEVGITPWKYMNE